MPNEASADVLVTVVCGLVVAFYAFNRYDTPETNRHTTTQSLFLISGAGYVLASLGLFLLLCQLVLKPGMLTFLGLEQAKEVMAKFSSPPVLAAVVLTTLLPNTAVLKIADAWLLKRFQALGSIPQGVRDLADDLKMEDFPVVEADLETIRKWVASEDEVPNELIDRLGADAADTPRGRLTRLVKLYREIERLASVPGYAAAFRSTQNTWQTIGADFRVFTAQSHAFFVLFDRLGPVDGAAGENALKQAKARYETVCAKMHRSLVEYLAQLLLLVEGSRGRVRNRVQALGFAGKAPRCPDAAIGPVVFTGVMVLVLVLGTVAFVRLPPGPLPVPVIAVIIATTQTVGLLAAILPKIRWAWFRRQEDGSLPYFGWLTSAAIGGIAAFVLDRSVYIVADGSFSAAFDFARFPLRPAAPMAAALSLTVTILCDVDLRLGFGWARRVTEGMLCGAALSVAIFLCLQLLDLPSVTKGQAPPWFPFAFSFTMGFIWGVVGPYWYRRAQDEEEHRPPESRVVLDPRVHA